MKKLWTAICIGWTMFAAFTDGTVEQPPTTQEAAHRECVECGGDSGNHSTCPFCAARAAYEAAL